MWLKKFFRNVSNFSEQEIGVQLARSRVKRSIRDPGALCQPAYILIARRRQCTFLSRSRKRCTASRGRERVGEGSVRALHIVSNSRPFSRGARKQRQWIRGRSIANPNPEWSHILRSLRLSPLGWRTLSSASPAPHRWVSILGSTAESRRASPGRGSFSFFLPHLYLFRYFSLSSAAARLRNHRSLACARAGV